MELKSCPFCGSPGNIQHRTSEVLNDYIPECTNDYCFASYMIGASFKSKEEAIIAWNKRFD